MTLDSVVDSIVAALTQSAEPVVLVGHSLGGMLISAAAEKAPERIEMLVYLAAFLPRNGESARSIEERNPKAVVPKSLIVAPDHVSATIMLDRVRDLFYHDCTEADIASATVHLRPLAVAPFSTPVQLTRERFGSVPRGYIECTEDHALSIEMQRDMIAKSPPVKVRTLPSSHSPFLSMPDRLAATLVDLPGG